jgi:hypothetical protein
MKGLSREGQKQVMNTLYGVIAEIDSDEKWKTLLDEKPESMEEIAAQALREHREKKPGLYDTFPYISCTPVSISSPAKNGMTQGHF